MKKSFLPLMAAAFLFSACEKSLENDDSTATGNLVFKYRFDSTQPRLNNIGQPSVMPAGNAGLNPRFNGMSAHYLELSPGALTPLGGGQVLFKADETTAGGGNAINFERITVAANNQEFFSIPIKNITPGSYEWMRLSLAYQNYDITFRIDTTISGIPINDDFNGTVASFIGFNTYIKSYKVKTDTITVNGNRKQGYWGMETNGTINGIPISLKQSGQAPDGATTVVNPLFATSPVPAGSCVVTAAFQPGKLVITGSETGDIVVEVVVSTNKSFEWTEIIPNGKWDPLKGERVVDMGVRGIKPVIQ